MISPARLMIQNCKTCKSCVVGEIFANIEPRIIECKVEVNISLVEVDSTYVEVDSFVKLVDYLP